MNVGLSLRNFYVRATNTTDNLCYPTTSEILRQVSLLCGALHRIVTGTLDHPDLSFTQVSTFLSCPSSPGVKEIPVAILNPNIL